MALQLVIGDKNYSSWSMHAWLLLRFVDMPFEEIAISLYVSDARQRVRELGGETGLVPVLSVDGHPIWDTLAITEFVSKQHFAVWPTDCFERGRARSYAGEVHSSLNDLRAAMPVNTRARNRSPVRTAAVEADIARVASIWNTSGNDPESPWLFRRFTAADIMFAPVATRFQTYNVAMSGRAAEYQERLLSHPLVHEWLALGELEPTVIMARFWPSFSQLGTSGAGIGISLASLRRFWVFAAGRNSSLAQIGPRRRRQSSFRMHSR